MVLTTLRQVPMNLAWSHNLLIETLVIGSVNNTARGVAEAKEADMVEEARNCTLKT